jgi:hypothetical protein
VRLAAATAIGLATISARADAAAPPAALVDELMQAGAAEAPIVVRIDPAALPSVRTFVRARVPWLLRDPFDDGLGAFAGLLGGDLFTPDGWKLLGLDPSRPVVIAIGRTTGARVLAAQHERAPIVRGGARPADGVRAQERLLVDVRVIVPVADRLRAAQAIARAAQIMPALAFGEPGRTLQIDLVIAPGPDGDEYALASMPVVEARSTRRAVLTRLRDAGGEMLASAAPIALHVDPRRLVETALWLRAAELADDAGPRVDEVRTSFAQLDPTITGTFGALGATIDLQGGTAAVHATIAVAPRSALATALATTADSGLPRPTDTPDAALHVHSYVAAISALIAAPRGGMTFDLPSQPSFEAGRLAPIFDALAWPSELGATMAHVVDAEPRARGIFDGLGDAVLVASSIGPDLPRSAAALEVAVTPDADAALHAVIDAVWGAPHAGAVTTWGDGRVRPFARTLPHGRAIGAALGGSGAAYLALARHAPAPAAGVVLELHAAPDALGLVAPLATFAGTLDLTARYQAPALAIDATLSP